MRHMQDNSGVAVELDEAVIKGDVKCRQHQLAK
jgi:hypothetical protein